MKVLVTGASGSGTSTLGAALASQMSAAFFDADDFFWQPGDPPYRDKRNSAERLALINAALECQEHAVVAGSVMGWGEALEDSFSLVVFLRVETAVRIERLRRRETERFGQANPEFLEWAAQYDLGPPEGRSLTKHEVWLAARPCQVIRLVGEASTTEQMRELTLQRADLLGARS